MKIAFFCCNDKGIYDKSTNLQFILKEISVNAKIDIWCQKNNSCYYLNKNIKKIIYENNEEIFLLLKVYDLIIYYMDDFSENYSDIYNVILKYNGLVILNNDINKKFYIINMKKSDVNIKYNKLFRELANSTKNRKVKAKFLKNFILQDLEPLQNINELIDNINELLKDNLINEQNIYYYMIDEITDVLNIMPINEYLIDKISKELKWLK